MPPKRPLRAPVLPAFARDVVDQAPSLPPSIVSPPVLVEPGASEIATRSYRVLALADVASATQTPEVVYATQKRWRGVDVYVQTSDGGTNGAIIVQIFAVLRGFRTLVASGRTRATTGKRVASVRVLADTFEVVVAHDNAWNADDTIQIIVAGTDEAVQDTDALAGCITPAPNENMFGSAGVGLASDGMPIELGAVYGVNVSAAVRYLMVFDSATTPVNGDAPRHTFALPIGLSTFQDGPGLRVARYRQGLFVMPSTSGGVLTIAAANDVFLQTWFR